jgi:ATP-binding cassette, subfamily A (ABC1), member 3
MIRGEIRPSHDGKGEIYIGHILVATDKETARSHLGVCPQHDAMDQLTVVEHLRFYAGVRGVRNAEQNVQALVTAIGLRPFHGQMGNKLSGGNKRKLSLAIALIGIIHFPRSNLFTNQFGQVIPKYCY